MPRRYLAVTEQDRQTLAEVARRLEPRADALLEEVAASLQDAEELADVVPPGDLREQLRPPLMEYLVALREGRTEAYLEGWSQRVRRRAEEGVPFEGLVVALMALEVAAARVIRDAFADDRELSRARDVFLRWNHCLLAAAAGAYLSGKEDTIRAQQQALLELSTPVVEVWRGILTLPLVGTIDTARTKQITQNLLHAIRSSQARVVILDISGVPLVDTKVANRLMKTLHAARLLGAQGIIVGISPEIAETLVTLDVDFRDIQTFFSLRQGLEAALNLLDLEVVPRRKRR